MEWLKCSNPYTYVYVNYTKEKKIKEKIKRLKVFFKKFTLPVDDISPLIAL